LGNGLAIANGEGVIGVGLVAYRVGDETVAGHHFHTSQELLIFGCALTQLRFDHGEAHGAIV